MTTKEFIEKAIEGGWNGNWIDIKEEWGVSNQLISWILLDPLAWQAVGKVERWGSIHNADGNWISYVWQDNMHAMIDVLCDGKSIEEFLETL